MSRSDIESRSDWLSKASILTDALPFMRRYADSRVVVKFGGHAMGMAIFLIHLRQTWYCCVKLELTL